MDPLLGMTKNELKKLSAERGWPDFTASQIAGWIYGKRISSIDEMSNLSKAVRAGLSESHQCGFTAYTKVDESVDGTKKYLFRTPEGRYIETAYIPERERHTVCVSTQVGCKMGCLFCMTGKQGFQGNLTAGEILNQLRSIDEWQKVTNIVYMGMGEPLDNLEQVMKSLEILTSPWGFAMSPRRITVSTIGIIPAMKEFLEKSEAHLAISLHSPFDNERRMLMPIQQVYPLEEVLNEVRSWTFGKQRRVSFEYIMFGDLNDTPRHSRELAKILNGIRCRINLIRFHPIPDTPLISSTENRIAAFRDELKAKGIITTVRASRGQDIYAACGLLSTRNLT